MKTRKTENQRKGTAKLSPHLKRKHNGPAITVDYERYAHFLESSDLTEEQKQEFLQAMWNIIVEFVSLGFGVHPMQLMKADCGKKQKGTLKPAPNAPDKVYLEQSILEHFIDVTDPKTGAEKEGVETQ